MGHGNDDSRLITLAHVCKSSSLSDGRCFFFQWMCKPLVHMEIWLDLYCTCLNLVEFCCFTVSYCFFAHFLCSFDPFTCILHSFPIFLLKFQWDFYLFHGLWGIAKVFPYWRLSDLKRAAGRVLCVKVGELTTVKGTLLCGDGTSLGEAGDGWCSTDGACQGCAWWWSWLKLLLLPRWQNYGLNMWNELSASLPWGKVTVENHYFDR